MTLLIDNYDSFSYNLYQALGSLDPNIKVIRNDELDLGAIRALSPTAIVISPGPGRCEDAGIIIEAAAMLSSEIPMLGVCLGHQAICTAFGATVTYASKLYHGKQSEISLDKDCPLFAGLASTQKVGRYHSLSVLASTLPQELVCTARSGDGQVMAVQHRTHPLFGVQFHPESILTPHGDVMLRNFLSYAQRGGRL